MQLSELCLIRSNPEVTPWVYDGDLTASRAPWVGELTIESFKFPPLPHIVPGGGVGVHIDRVHLNDISVMDKLDPRFCSTQPSLKCTAKSNHITGVAQQLSMASASTK